MPKVEAIMICDAIQPLPTGKVSAVGLSGSIALPICPTAFSFGTVAEISGLETGREFEVELEVLDPDGGVVTKSQSKMNLPKANGPAIMAADFRNLVFRQLGTYHIRISVDGKNIGERTLQVSINEGESS